MKLGTVIYILIVAQLQFSTPVQIITMSDLSCLFTTPIPSYHLSPTNNQIHAQTLSPIQANLRSQTVPVAPTNTWSITELESSLKKGIKRKIKPQKADLQIQEFQKKKKEQIAKSISVIAGILLVIYIFVHIDHRIIFHLALFSAVRILPSLPLKLVQQPIINRSLHTIRPIVYAALYYYLLKKMLEADMAQLNFSLTFATLVATSIHATLYYFRKVFALSQEQLLIKMMCQKDNKLKIMLMGCLILSKARFIFEMWKYILYAGAVSCFCLYITAIVLEIDTSSFFEPRNGLAGIIIFVMLQLVVELNAFVLSLFERQIVVVRDKMPIVLTLLRLQRTPFTRAIQQVCVMSLLRRSKRVPCFLSTETVKSLIYDTYMDLFNEFATSQLEHLHSKISNILSNVRQNSKIYHSDKNILQDIFIYPKKAMAYIAQFNQVVTVLALMADVNQLIRTVVIADEQGSREHETAKVNPRVIDILKLVKSKLDQVKGKALTRGIILSQLQRYQKKMEGWLFSMQNGWVIQ